MSRGLFGGQGRTEREWLKMDSRAQDGRKKLAGRIYAKIDDIKTRSSWLGHIYTALSFCVASVHEPLLAFQGGRKGGRVIWCKKALGVLLQFSQKRERKCIFQIKLAEKALFFLREENEQVVTLFFCFWHPLLKKVCGKFFGSESPRKMLSKKMSLFRPNDGLFPLKLTLSPLLTGSISQVAGFDVGHSAFLWVKNLFLREGRKERHLPSFSSE